jgi:hypothetical protein
MPSLLVEMGSCKLLVWSQIANFYMVAFQVAGITDMSHQLLTCLLRGGSLKLFAQANLKS